MGEVEALVQFAFVRRVAECYQEVQVAGFGVEFPRDRRAEDVETRDATLFAQPRQVFHAVGYYAVHALVAPRSVVVFALRQQRPRFSEQGRQVFCGVVPDLSVVYR